MEPGFRQALFTADCGAEMSKATAVSSTLNPPKKRSSITLLCVHRFRREF